mgnify:CR=1 FL=1
MSYAISGPDAPYYKQKPPNRGTLMRPERGPAPTSPHVPAAPQRRIPMNTKNFPLEAYARPSAAKSWCRRLWMRSPRITVRPASPMWPAVTASLWPMSASASGRRQAVLIRNCSRSTGWRLRPPAAPQRLEHPADHHLRRLREHQLFLPPVPRAVRPEPP